MKNHAKKSGDRFDKFFEVEAFDPENSEHNKIVQKRIKKHQNKYCILNL